LSDLVGAGSEKFGKDGRKDNGSWERGAPGLREKGWQDIRGLMSGNRRKRSVEEKDEMMEQKKRGRTSDEFEPRMDVIRQGREPTTTTTTTTKEVAPGYKSSSTAEHIRVRSETIPVPPPPPAQIFRNLNIYLNGSTAPLISDHKLKQLFSRHGGNTSIALGRRTVTHVIIGNGCGGGLASGKIQKEVALVGGKGVKYVTAQWVLDSIEKGIRQPEARYVPKPLDGRIGGSGQGSVRDMFVKKTTK